MTTWVAGLLTDGSRVAFIRKNRPAWQAGKFNLIGGKVEENESFSEAMTREFEEEAGLRVENWKLFLTLSFKEGVVVFYTARVDRGTLDKVRSVTDEQVSVLRPHELFESFNPFIPNLEWIVPLGMHTHDVYEPVHVTEVEDA